MSAPASVASFVRGVARRSRAARALESLALGTAAGAATAAAAALSGAEVAGAPALAACALSGLACAATWAFEHRRSLADFARRADERLGATGALATAFECEARGATATLERALAARVLARLAPDSAKHASHAPAIAIAGAPLIAAALLAAVLEGAKRDRDSRAAHLAVAAARGAGSGSPSASPSGAELAPPGPDAPFDAPLDGPKERTAPAEGDEPRDAAGVPTHSGAGNSEAEPIAGADANGSGAGREPGAPSASGAGAGDLAPGLAQGAAEPTMASSSAPAEGSMTTESPQIAPVPAGDPSTAAPPVADPRTREAGTLAGRWWPARHDEIVRAWLAARPR